MNSGYRLFIAGGWRNLSGNVTSVIVGAAIGAVFFKKRFGTPRLVAAGLLMVGLLAEGLLMVGIGLMPRAG